MLGMRWGLWRWMCVALVSPSYGGYIVFADLVFTLAESF